MKNEWDKMPAHVIALEEWRLYTAPRYLDADRLLRKFLHLVSSSLLSCSRVRDDAHQQFNSLHQTMPDDSTAVSDEAAAVTRPSHAIPIYPRRKGTLQALEARILTLRCL